jgi:hypothetical protein
VSPKRLVLVSYNASAHVNAIFPISTQPPPPILAPVIRFGVEFLAEYTLTHNCQTVGEIKSFVCFSRFVRSVFFFNGSEIGARQRREMRSLLFSQNIR